VEYRNNNSAQYKDFIRFTVMVRKTTLIKLTSFKAYYKLWQIVLYDKNRIDPTSAVVRQIHDLRHKFT
jgi:hypothetical protein